MPSKRKPLHVSGNFTKIQIVNSAIKTFQMYFVLVYHSKRAVS